MSGLQQLIFKTLPR